MAHQLRMFSIFLNSNEGKYWPSKTYVEIVIPISVNVTFFEIGSLQMEARWGHRRLEWTLNPMAGVYKRREKVMNTETRKKSMRQQSQELKQCSLKPRNPKISRSHLKLEKIMKDSSKDSEGAWPCRPRFLASRTCENIFLFSSTP